MKLDAADKKLYLDKLTGIVGRIGIVRTLTLLAKVVEPEPRTGNLIHDHELCQCLEGHAITLRYAKSICKERIKKLREKRNSVKY